MTKMKSKGEWKLGRRVHRNTLFQSAFDLVGDLLTGTQAREFGSIRLLDVSEGTIATEAVSFSYQALSPGPGIVITGEATFAGVDITADAHHIALLDTDGTVLAQADISSEPIPQGVTTIVTRSDTFAPGA